MASEYWKWKFRDVQPEEKKELTAEEKRRNWWEYHKWHLAAAAGLLVILGSIAWDVVSQVRPDCQIAYVGSAALPDGAAAALEDGFARLGEDLNGDGRTVVQLRQYAGGGDNPQMALAVQTALMADLTNGDSCFFLLEDPEQFQREYQALALVDGSLPEEGDFSGEGTYFAWEQCPALASMELAGGSEDLVSGLFIARRGFWREKDAAYPEGWAAMWDRMTEGAERVSP